MLSPPLAAKACAFYNQAGEGGCGARQAALRRAACAALRGRDGKLEARALALPASTDASPWPRVGVGGRVPSQCAFHGYAGTARTCLPPSPSRNRLTPTLPATSTGACCH